MTIRIEIPEVPLPDGVTADRISGLAGLPLGHVPGDFTLRLTAPPPDQAGYGTRGNPWVLVGDFFDGSARGSGRVRYWLTDDGRHITGTASGFTVSWWAARIVLPGWIFALAIFLFLRTGGEPGYLALMLVNVPFIWIGYVYAPRAWRLMLQGIAQSGLRAIFHEIAGTDPGTLRLWDDADRFAATRGWSALGPMFTRPGREQEQAHRWRKRAWWWVIVRSLIAAWSALNVFVVFAGPDDFTGKGIITVVVLYTILLITTAVVPVVMALRRVRRRGGSSAVPPPADVGDRPGAP